MLTLRATRGRLSAPNPAQNLELAWGQESPDVPSPAPVCAPDHPDQRRSQELEQRAVALTEVTLAALQVHRPRTSRWRRKPNTEAVVDPERLPHAVVEVEFPHPAARKAVGELQDAALYSTQSILQRILRAERFRGPLYLRRPRTYATGSSLRPRGNRRSRRQGSNSQAAPETHAGTDRRPCIRRHPKRVRAPTGHPCRPA
jgi:hypothetical protein